MSYEDGDEFNILPGGARGNKLLDPFLVLCMASLQLVLRFGIPAVLQLNDVDGLIMLCSTLTVLNDHSVWLQRFLPTSFLRLALLLLLTFDLVLAVGAATCMSECDAEAIPMPVFLAFLG